MYNILMKLSFMWAGIFLAFSTLSFTKTIEGGVAWGIIFGIAFIVLFILGNGFLARIYTKISDMLTEDNK